MREYRLDITEKKAPVYHRAMWRWLAKNPLKSKFEWPAMANANNTVAYECFACEIAIMRRNNVSDPFGMSRCLHCPITEWREAAQERSKYTNTASCPCNNKSGLYRTWSSALCNVLVYEPSEKEIIEKHIAVIKETAQQLAEMEWK